MGQQIRPPNQTLASCDLDLDLLTPKVDPDLLTPKVDRFIALSHRPLMSICTKTGSYHTIPYWAAVA